MNRSYSNALLWSCSLAWGLTNSWTAPPREPANSPNARSRLSNQCSSQPAAQAKLAVRLYNYTEVSVRALRGALEETQQVFRQAGVEMVWIECRTTLEEAPKHPACRRQRGPSVVILSILPRHMDRRAAVRDDVFGLANPEAGMASVLFHRVEQLAEANYMPVEVVLGHIVAHEIGHVLLGHKSHSRNRNHASSMGQGGIERSGPGHVAVQSTSDSANSSGGAHAGVAGDGARMKATSIGKPGSTATHRLRRSKGARNRSVIVLNRPSGLGRRDLRFAIGTPPDRSENVWRQPAQLWVDRATRKAPFGGGGFGRIRGEN